MDDAIIPLVKAITDGVVLDPSAFSITLGVLPSIIATQEFVVPKSMPITAPLTPSDLNLRWIPHTFSFSVCKNNVNVLIKN